MISYRDSKCNQSKRKKHKKERKSKKKRKKKDKRKGKLLKEIIYYVTMIFLNKIYFFDNLGDDDGTNEGQGKEY